MTAHTAKSNLAFELPRQTYINVRLEEPNLYAYEAPAEKSGPLTWIAQRLAAFTTRSRDAEQMAELRAMTDRELADIGISRGDISRAFIADHARDMYEALALLG